MHKLAVYSLRGGSNPKSKKDVAQAALLAAAMSQVVSLANRARGQMPPSVLPPFVMRFDAANVPIGYLVLESKTRPLGQLADLGLYRIRPLLIAQIPGTVSFSPYGSNTRAIVIKVDPDRLRALAVACAELSHPPIVP